ncbi:LacI family transcriptional regulator [Opitutaceae bacterium TAV4]|uniref:LacI family DNA-binding transcriptional regulator n=1 Tax=Geminisphaera colitermitum TaxID=1148786 RepID=UPI0001964E16|nr:LacI family DNA-binding transcriptional regulator [Geminisphaera colitermitum]RRJ94367.1 LacI family transcriptional regulator [Opitutaceae bacterium TAV4]RRJ98458.1 LacI family transcriptional regulator [Opitutaceae bacterium TAV3]
MTPPRRITQKDIARAARLTPAAVSLALRNDPSIPPRTCARVQRLAAKLGYAPDPMLGALSRYRLRTNPVGFHGNLAWLASTTADFDWRQIPHFVEYVEGAREQAVRHGYNLAILDLTEAEGSWRRVGDVAIARGVHGLLLCPQPYPDASISGLHWDKFSVVTFGYSLKNPDLHSVAPAHYQATLDTMERLHALGYRRIGFATIRSHDQRTNHNFLAGYLAVRTLLGLPEIPPYLGEHWWTEEALRDWISNQWLDAVLTCDVRFNRCIEQWRLPVPHRLGVACPMLPSASSGLTGMLEDNRRIGAAAVNMLVAMIQRNERGVPGHPQRLLIPGSWHQGTTLRRISPPVRVT